MSGSVCSASQSSSVSRYHRAIRHSSSSNVSSKLPSNRSAAAPSSGGRGGPRQVVRAPAGDVRTAGPHPQDLHGSAAELIRIRRVDGADDRLELPSIRPSPEHLDQEVRAADPVTPEDVLGRARGEVLARDLGAIDRGRPAEREQRLRLSAAQSGRDVGCRSAERVVVDRTTGWFERLGDRRRRRSRDGARLRRHRLRCTCPCHERRRDDDPDACASMPILPRAARR